MDVIIKEAPETLHLFYHVRTWGTIGPSITQNPAMLPDLGIPSSRTMRNKSLISHPSLESFVLTAPTHQDRKTLTYDKKKTCHILSPHLPPSKTNSAEDLFLPGRSQ